jgi:mRNA interferase MazF
MAVQPSRGEIWLTDRDPTRGHEQAGVRPVLIVSNDIFNHGLANMVWIVPLTRTGRRIPYHVAIDPPEGGVRERSYILCDNLRSISKERLKGPPWGIVSRATLDTVADYLAILLDLPGVRSGG